MAVVEVERLAKVFRAKEKAPGLRGSLRSLRHPVYRDVEAVRDISFSIEAGEVVAFIGPNGAGKSTTIKMLSGILHASSGEARVLGLVPWQQRQQLAYRIGTLFGQRSQLWYHLPASDSFALLATIYELEPRAFRQRMGDLVERFEVAHLLDVPVRKLSLGERMRCEIVGALLHRPEVVFLDEPTIGLDVVAKQRIRTLVRALSCEEGVTVFLTSHDAGDVEQICDRAIVINHGDVIFDDSVGALRGRFIRRRLIELKLNEPIEAPRLPGVTVLAGGDYELSLEVDMDAQAVEPVVAAILAQGSVADITITEPPLEEIIGRIYGAAR